MVGRGPEQVVLAWFAHATLLRGRHFSLEQPRISNFLDGGILKPACLVEPGGADSCHCSTASSRTEDDWGKKPANPVHEVRIEEAPKDFTTAFNQQADDFLFGQALEQGPQGNSVAVE